MEIKICSKNSVDNYISYKWQILFSSFPQQYSLCITLKTGNLLPYLIFYIWSASYRTLVSMRARVTSLLIRNRVVLFTPGIYAIFTHKPSFSILTLLYIFTINHYINYSIFYCVYLERVVTIFLWMKIQLKK